MLILTLGSVYELIYSMMFVYIIQNIMLLLQLIKHRNGIKTLKNIEKH